MFQTGSFEWASFRTHLLSHSPTQLHHEGQMRGPRLSDRSWKMLSFLCSTEKVAISEEVLASLAFREMAQTRSTTTREENPLLFALRRQHGLRVLERIEWVWYNVWLGAKLIQADRNITHSIYGPSFDQKDTVKHWSSQLNFYER